MKQKKIGTRKYDIFTNMIFSYVVAVPVVVERLYDFDLSDIIVDDVYPNQDSLYMIYEYCLISINHKEVFDIHFEMLDQ